jgi:hypothetical protein
VSLAQLRRPIHDFADPLPNDDMPSAARPYATASAEVLRVLGWDSADPDVDLLPAPLPVSEPEPGVAMTRGSLWNELGRERERRRRSEVARLRAEAQILRDDQRSTVGSRRDTAAQERAERDAEAARRQDELDARIRALTGVLRAVVASPIPTIGELRDVPAEVEPTPFDEQAPRWADFAPPERGLLRRLRRNRAVGEAQSRFEEALVAFESHRAVAAEQHRARVADAQTAH